MTEPQNPPQATVPVVDADLSTPAGAAAYEAALAAAGYTLRRGHVGLDEQLLDALQPLLQAPIPSAYIQRTPAVKGKPYESTGVRSVQVQIDRMNNVLGPTWWWDEAEYSEGGKLCVVTVCIGNRHPSPTEVMAWQEHEPIQVGPPGLLLARSSYGGVGQGSTLGNLYKGSYTNAAKRAFAMVGPGHEIYVGETDLDPDVNADAAAAGAGGTAPTSIGTGAAKALVDRAWEVPAAKEKLQLAASHAAEKDVGDCSTKAKATAALAKLNYAAAERLGVWLTQKEADRG